MQTYTIRIRTTHPTKFTVTLQGFDDIFAIKRSQACANDENASAIEVMDDNDRLVAGFPCGWGIR